MTTGTGRAGLVALLLAITGCYMNGFGPGDCVSTPPATITFTGGQRDATTVGFTYRQGVAASAGTMLGPSYAIEAVQAPFDAQVDSHGVTWLPSAGAAGITQPFHLRSDTDLCGKAADLAWTVHVYPAIEITSFTATPPVASTAGTPVTLQAVYTGGVGALVGPFEAPFPSGATLDAGTVSSTTTFTLQVVNPAGDQIQQALTVVAQGP